MAVGRRQLAVFQVLLPQVDQTHEAHTICTFPALVTSWSVVSGVGCFPLCIVSVVNPLCSWAIHWQNGMPVLVLEQTMEPRVLYRCVLFGNRHTGTPAPVREKYSMWYTLGLHSD
ncbi:hypothetical protein EDC04DRAFT_2599434 [Pisolithus marmoratus]|nr:hypothetical protein EDC04DRAFT_2599434 [Pisolithus marmoratus]